MRLFQKVKDGGPDSPVDAYVLCEFKGLFTIAVLKFNKGHREAYHTHAFNAHTWFLKGLMAEQRYEGGLSQYKRSWKPKFTSRSNNHRVWAIRDSWCFTIRGPWAETWTETLDHHTTVLTHGRKVV